MFVNGFPGNSNVPGLKTIDLAFSLQDCEVMCVSELVEQGTTQDRLETQARSLLSYAIPGSDIFLWV